ncbi:hypothetical protein CFAM422_008966 [Trichoderma lentiforme]|uniref:Uncharacterized protein n=1 Tax=Trichoderma lentiforme TaxID=1567552 RepID=A0A9P5CC42_9HYPO|nr:hypothetical protein CFAM422_008966 [Trichoderma lentiforme]
MVSSQSQRLMLVHEATGDGFKLGYTTTAAATTTHGAQRWQKQDGKSQLRKGRDQPGGVARHGETRPVVMVD